ncbi:MAG TPA: UDP-glucose/GDP-mannose dehydrogenase family protein [Candidatus Binatia bacterium]|nr:UDP-glucose/GDP-mannose dehydrogenase family protein [Candidatus Binatia bacterium]
MKIAVVGTGYVGLVTGVCFADSGNEVVGIDIDESKVSQLKKGQLPIYEPDLEKIYKRSLSNGRLHFTTDLASGIKGALVIFLALPTPPQEDGSADLSYILGVAKSLGPLIKNYAVIVNKSTVPVGTAEKVHSAVAERAKSDFDVVSNPEFLREGLAVSDFMKPDRIVVGTRSPKAKKVMKELYAPFLRQGNPMLFMDERSSEMTKYAANAFLAMKISFMNEIANLSEKTGANVDDIRLGIGTDERIGKRFLFPGIGYGGSCFPKDVLALQKTAEQHDYDFRILEAVTAVNKLQKQSLFKKLSKYYKNDLAGKTFALWGLAFKPDTDDIREAPSLEIIDAILEAGGKVQAFDPEAGANIKHLYAKVKGLRVADTQYDALNGADALLIATEWSEFRTPDFEQMAKRLNRKVIFDGRNLYNPTDVKKQKFHYESVGRPIA